MSTISRFTAPEIVWNYYGKLRDVMLEAACQDLVDTVRSDQCPRVVLVPTASADVVKKQLGRAKLGPSLTCSSGTAKSLDNYLKTPVDRLVCLPENGTKDLVGECRNLERVVRRRRQSSMVLPAPGLGASDLIRLVNEAPSALLDGSHSSEQRLPERLAALPEPFGPLVSAAWSELQGTTDLSLLSHAAFERRLAQLHPSVLEAPLWSNVIGLWRAILRGMEDEQASVHAWISGIESRADARAGLPELNGIAGNKEWSVFASHALKDPHYLPFPAIVFGHTWALDRYAQACFDRLIGSPSAGNGGSLFEAG